MQHRVCQIISVSHFQLKGTTENRTGRGIFTDDAYLDVLSLSLVSGRYFNKSFGTDTLSILLNEKAVTALGIKGRSDWCQPYHTRRATQSTGW